MPPADVTQGPVLRALLIVLSQVDAAAYGSDLRRGCEGCLHDLAVMERLLSPLGYHVSSLTDEDANITEVVQALTDIAVNSRPGDVFLLYYTGHGDQLIDQAPGHPDRDEPDGLDECFCLYDGKWRDDSLYNIWLKFPPGALIYCITDSCRSGSSMRSARRRSHRAPLHRAEFITPQDAFPCPLLHIAASRDDTLAQGGEDGSLLTTNIERLWNKGQFNGTWDDFFDALARDMPTQALQGNLYGPDHEIVASLLPFSPLRF